MTPPTLALRHLRICAEIALDIALDAGGSEQIRAARRRLLAATHALLATKSTATAEPQEGSQETHGE